jgi:large subunit ribosomal protein L24
MKFGSHLSKELREKYGRRSLRPREGDTVKIIRGEFKGIEGKVTKVIAKEGKINVEGVTREKVKGGTAPINIDSSKVMIISINTEDKVRMKKLEGKK